MQDNIKSTYSGLILIIIFMAMTIMKVAGISPFAQLGWVWILMPLWIGPAIVISVLILLLFIFLIFWAIGAHK